MPRYRKLHTKTVDGPGYVYLLRRADGWYRIGRTINPVQRFRQWRWMDKANHYGLEPILLVHVDKHVTAERILHKAFDDKRTDERHQGYGPCHEWFYLDALDILHFRNWTQRMAHSYYELDGSWCLPCHHDE